MAMTGAGKVSRRRTSCRKGSSHPSGSRRPFGSSSTSWPEDQTLTPGAARKTMTRAFSSSKPARASMRSPTRVAQSALCLAGLSRVMVPIDWASSDLIRGMAPRFAKQRRFYDVLRSLSLLRRGLRCRRGSRVRGTRDRKGLLAAGSEGLAHRGHIACRRGARG